MSQELLQVLQSSTPLGDKLKKLNQVAKQLSEAEVDNLIKQLKLNANLEEVLVKVIDKFQRLPEAVYILQHGTRTNIQQAVKLPWLYVTPGSPLTSSEYLIEQLFPRIAFTTRQKVINNLGNHLREGQVADEIFQAVQAKYGISIAFPMLQACSEEFVRSTLKSSKLTLLAPQLLAILQRYPEVGIQYIKDHPYLSFDISICLNYLADHHPQELLQLKKDYPNGLSVNLGSRRSKKILKSYTQDCVELAGADSVLFKASQLRKRLSQEQLVKVLLKAVPKIGETLNSCWDSDSVWRYLDDLPKSRQLEILESAFQTTYKKSVVDCPESVSAEVISMLGNPADRERLINWKIKNDTTDQRFRFSRHHYAWFSESKWFWKALKPTSVSIPELTKILNAEKDCNNRVKLFRILILSCIVNNDSVQLLKVFQLLTKKSRNDKIDVRRALIEGMYDASHVMEFQQDHWACFDEVLSICQLYKEIRSIGYVYELLHKQVAYLLENNLPIKEKLTFIVKTSFEAGSSWNFTISGVKGAENQRKLIESYVTVMESVSAVETGHQKLESMVFGTLAQEIDKWNRINRNVNKINISSFPWLDRRCKELFNLEDNDPETTYHVRENRKLFRVLMQDDNFQEKFLDENLQSFIHDSVLSFSWRKYPGKVRESLEHIVKTALKADNKIRFRPFLGFIVQVKKAGGNEKMIEKIRDECNSVLENPQNQDSGDEAIVTNAIKILAVINQPEDFLTFARGKYPVEMKIDPKDINEVDYEIKKAIAESLKSLKDPRLALKSVEKFCGGDYLKLVLGSLYSVCNALPEHEILLFLRTQLKEKPAVSVKKHMIRLFFSIAPLQEKNAILRDMWAAENNPTIRFEILAQFYNLLKNNCEKGVWENLQAALESLTDEDTPSLEHLKSCCSLDDNLQEFTTDFFKLILHTFDRVGAEEDYKFQVYSRISTVISKLADNFLDDLVRVAFKTSLEAISRHCQVVDLVVKYLVNDHISEETQGRRLEKIQPIVQDLYVNHWDKWVTTYGYTTSQCFVTKSLLKLFFQTLSCNVISCKNKTLNKKKIIEEFLLQLQTIPDLSRTFRNIFTLQVTSLVLDQQNCSEGIKKLENVGKGVAGLIDSYLKVHGSEFLLVTNVVLQSVWEFLFPDFCRDHVSALIHGILLAGETKSNILTAIALRTEAKPADNKELGEMYDHMLEVIKKSEDKTIRTFAEVESANSY